MEEMKIISEDNCIDAIQYVVKHDNLNNIVHTRKINQDDFESIYSQYIKIINCNNTTYGELCVIDNKIIHYCEICNSHKQVCFNEQKQLFLCHKHRSQVSKYGDILKRTKFDKNKITKYNNYFEMELYNLRNEVSGITLISNDKLDIVTQHKWYLRNDNYIETSFKVDNKKVKALLHRFIMNVSNSNEQVDHINRKPLDNRNENLRIVTNSENQVNQGKMKNNTSGVTGVTWDESRCKWKVSLNIHSKCYNLGRFDTLEEAKQVRLEAEKKYHGEYIPIERK